MNANLFMDFNARRRDIFCNRIPVDLQMHGSVRTEIQDAQSAAEPQVCII
jgi:hypothetical protein